MYLSMVAPYANAIWVISEKYSFKYCVKASGCSDSEVDVKSLISLKNTVSFLRLVATRVSYLPANKASPD